MQVFRSSWNHEDKRGVILVSEELNSGDRRIENFVPMQEILAEIGQQACCCEEVYLRIDEAFVPQMNAQEWSQVGFIAIELRKHNITATIC